MTKIFLGGSRHAGRLSSQIREKLDDIIQKNFLVVVGDAKGADRAFQEYFREKNYRNVEVFCTEGICRNNVGNWPTRDIPAETSKRDAQFYSCKDRAMAQEAEIGLMMWDGKSIGTLLNMYRLLALSKKVAVYNVLDKSFSEFQNQIEWETFLRSRDVALQKKVEQRKKLEPSEYNSQTQMSFFD